MGDIVTDDELLYRCIFCGLNKYYSAEQSGLKFSSQAFTDRNQAPSIDRVKLCGYNPKHTQKNLDDGIISLVAGEVRAIDSIVQNDSKGVPLFVYKIDVHPRPTVSNLAHAQIEPSPGYKGKAFRKVLEKLAWLATERVKNRGWEIEPCDLRSETR